MGGRGTLDILKRQAIKWSNILGARIWASYYESLETCSVQLTLEHLALKRVLRVSIYWEFQEELKESSVANVWVSIIKPSN